MNKLLNWLSSSNHWKHLIGGLVIGLISLTIWTAIVAGVGIAGAMEFKDKSWGGSFDWEDFGATMIGVGIGLIICQIIVFLSVGHIMMF